MSDCFCKKKDKQIGEDRYYQEMIKINKNFEPIQLGYFKLKCNTCDEFSNIIGLMINRVEKYVWDNWDDVDDPICEELNNTNDLCYLNCKKIKVLKFLYHTNSKSIYIIINHAKVGGGDYLILGSKMFNGKTNSLISEPNDTIIDNIVCQLYKIRFMYYILSNIYFKDNRDVTKKETIINSIINLKDNKLDYPNIKTKYIIIYKIMCNIMDSLINTDRLECWIPMGFIKTQNSPNNNIGILLFTFLRGMSLLEMQNQIEGNQYLLLGSYQYIKENNSVSTEENIKTKIDVVLTLANIIDNDIKVNWCTGGMYAKMNINSIFPFYIWGMTMNDEAHITYSVSDKLCNINKLIQKVNGTNITDEYIYKLNNN